LIRVAQHLEDAHGGGALKNSLGPRIFFFRIFLRGERDYTAALPDIIYKLERGRARYQEGMNLARKYYDPAQREDGQDIGNLDPAKILFNVELFFTFGLICL
jgi:hypothetical protein